MKVLQHKQRPLLGLLLREHVHKCLIANGRQRKPALAMHLLSPLLLIRMLFASRNDLPGQLPRKQLHLCEILLQVFGNHIGSEATRVHQVALLLGA